jgi:hypothetical protein
MPDHTLNAVTVSRESSLVLSQRLTHNFTSCTNPIVFIHTESTSKLPVRFFRTCFVRTRLTNPKTNNTNTSKTLHCQSLRYGWKLQQVRNYLINHRHLYDIALFIDSFDTYAFADPTEIVEKFLTFDAPMVVSGEVNIWPEPQLKEFLPPSTKEGHYKYVRQPDEFMIHALSFSHFAMMSTCCECRSSICEPPTRTD